MLKTSTLLIATVLALLPQQVRACTNWWIAYARGIAYPVSATDALSALPYGQLGTLLVRLDAARYYVIDKAGCYDLSGQKLRGQIEIVFDHQVQDSSSTIPTYVGFQVVRAVPNLDYNYLKFYRNESTDSKSHWLLPKPVDAIGNVAVDDRLTAQNAVPARSEFQRELYNKDNPKALLGELNTDNLDTFLGHVGDWHALIATGQGANVWNVVENSAQDSESWHLSPADAEKIAGKHKWVVNNLILKFTPSVRPKSPVYFMVGAENVDCIYIRPIAHADHLTRFRIASPVTLKIRRGATCEDPDQAFH